MFHIEHRTFCFGERRASRTGNGGRWWEVVGMVGAVGMMGVVGIMGAVGMIGAVGAVGMIGAVGAVGMMGVKNCC